MRHQATRHVLSLLGVVTLATLPAAADEISERRAFERHRVEAEVLVQKADESHSDALYSKGAEAYASAHTMYCNATAPKGLFVPSEPLCHELAYNAAVAFRAGHQRLRAHEMFRLVASDLPASHSALAVKSAFLLARDYQDLALYDEAAQWNERAAASNPKHEQSPLALRDAFSLRLGLGNVDAALGNLRAFERSYLTTRAVEVAELAIALATHLCEHDDWARARAVLLRYATTIDRSPLDLRVQAHTLTARELRRRTNAARAHQAYRKVIALWQNVTNPEETIRSAWSLEAEDKQLRRLAQALGAVGEAMFAIADQVRTTEVEPLKLPMQSGPSTQNTVNAYVAKLSPLIAKKKSAVERADQEFQKVLEIKPSASPIWIVASTATVAAMWGDFADELRTLLRCRLTADLCQAYRATVEDAIFPIETLRAKPVMQMCVSTASKYRIVDARVRHCEAWLAKHYQSEFHLTDEFIPAFRGGIVWPQLAPLDKRDAQATLDKFD